MRQDDRRVPAEAGIVTVRPVVDVMTRQRLPGFVGISRESAGARALSMYMVVIPPGASAEAHFHEGCETAIYMISGRVETRYGPGLRRSVVNEAGDFILIPPSVPHRPVNLSATEPAVAIVARNDPDEQERVVLYDADVDAHTDLGG
ncbi:MAG: cupin domain-containing protein [Alphaproteobacteria bacterium]